MPTHCQHCTPRGCAVAESQANNDLITIMEDLVYIYWDYEFPSVAESPEASPPTTGASATQDNE